MKAKRIASFAVACILILVTSFQPVAYAQLNSKTYNPVFITIPSKEGDLEQSFREFVKDVSDMYFSEGYDLNKYYYRASEIKNQWDKGFFVKNNPYSTYSLDGSLVEYNKYAILDSLVQGLQKKVDRMEQIGVDDYFPGFEFNIAKGIWEYDNGKVLEQKIYNEEVSAAINQTLIEAYADICNSVIDITNAFVFKGDAAQRFETLVDSFTSIVSEALKSRAKSLHENAEAALRNELRDVVKMEFLGLISNLDEQLLEALNSERRALALKVQSSDEKLRYEQIDYLLKAINTANDSSLSNSIDEAAERVADDLMDQVGLEVHTALSLEEINKIMYRDIAVAFTKELTKWLIASLDCSDLPEAILQSAVESLVQLVADDLTDSLWVDYNGDGAHDEYEMVLSEFEHFFTQDNLKSVVTAFCQELIKCGLNKELKDLEKQYFGQLFNWGDICKEYVDKLRTAPPKEVNKILEEFSYVKGDLVESEQMLDEIRRTAYEYNFGSVKVLVDDILTLCYDLLLMSRDAWTLGDVADGEVFFASVACSMYHTMERAESIRSIIKSKYSGYKDHSAIDNADVKELKDFVNCVYSVFELDKTGHKYYMDLLAGWEYQSSGKRLEEIEPIRMQNYINLIDEYGGWGNVMIIVAGPVMEAAYYWLEVCKSEYLKEVAAQDGWIDAAKTVATYLQISNCANQAEMPIAYSGL